jgi:flagellin
MRINTNTSALTAFGNLSRVDRAVSDSMAKLSSGFRINKAADDAAGLGIANKLHADVRAVTQASRNAEQANSVLQVAEGATNQIQKIVERMKELGTQAGSDNTDDAGRTRIKAEYDALVSEITAIASTTKFQGKSLIDGNFGTSVDTNTANSTVLVAAQDVYGVRLSGTAAGTYAVTDQTGTANQIRVTFGSTSQTITLAAGGKQSVTFDQFGITLDLAATFVRNTDGSAGNTASATGNLVVSAGSSGGSFLVRSSGAYTTNDLVTLSNINLTTGASGLNIAAITFTGSGTAAEWRTALSSFDTALDTVNTALGTIGSATNRIGYALDNAKSTIENFQAAESVIRDVDMAEEMTKFSKNQILSQAGTAMLAQANQRGLGVLQLLQG